ncbi:hypothetical protein OAA76_05045 [Planktotalea frisia]|jgi:hypothetical protein|nr:hypothetical protein [Planktotalea frisia]
MITEQYICDLVGAEHPDDLPWTPPAFQWPQYDRDYYETWEPIWSTVEAEVPGFNVGTLLAGYFQTPRLEACFKYVERVFSAKKWEAEQKTKKKKLFRA